jgi:hypothetical protein
VMRPALSRTRRPPREKLPRRCDGTRVPTRQPRGLLRPQEARAGLLGEPCGLSGTSRSRGLPFGTRVRRFVSRAILWLPAPPHRWSFAIAP